MEEDLLRRRRPSIRAWGLAAATALCCGCGGGSPPPTALVRLDELQARVQAPRAHPMLLVFWATWCKPCVEEIPDLAAMHRRHAGDLQILAVSLDAFLHSAERSLELVAAQHRQTPMPYENLVFVGGQDDLFTAFDLPGGIPYAVLLDAEGRALQRFNGRVDPGAVTAILEERSR